jgi:DNA-binding transcriptional regulator YiaG
VPIPLERLGPLRNREAEAKELVDLRVNVFHLTQAQMAQLLDVHAQTYHRWERGQKDCPFSALELMRCWAREDRQPPRRNKR